MLSQWYKQEKRVKRDRREITKIIFLFLHLLIFFMCTDMKNPYVQNKKKHGKFIWYYICTQISFLSLLFCSYKNLSFIFTPNGKSFMFFFFLFVFHSFAISSPTTEKEKNKVNLKKLSDRNFSIKTILFFLWFFFGFPAPC